MELQWEKFQKSYQNASKEVKELIDSRKIGACVQQQVDIGTVEENQQSSVVLTISHLTLATITAEQAYEHLKSLGVPKANEIIDSIQTCTADPTTEGLSLESDAEDAKTEDTPKPDAEPTYSSTQAAILQEGRKPKAADSVPPDTAPPSKSSWG